MQGLFNLHNEKVSDIRLPYRGKIVGERWQYFLQVINFLADYPPPPRPPSTIFP